MRIHGFIQDSNFIIYALYEVDCKKGSSMIWTQGGRSYITTGAKITNDLEKHYFSETQEAALNAFSDSAATMTAYNIAL